MQPPAARHWLRYGLALVSAAALAHCLSICAGIVHAAGEEDSSRRRHRSLRRGGVFRASLPVYRARLDHAFDLFRRGVAPVVITTGGAAADPSFSEGGVGHDYLMGRGIPDASLIAETQGTDTAQSAERVAVIMRANHMRSCVAVSDAYHVFRIRKLLQHENVQVYTAPRPDSRPHSPWQRAEAVVREAASYLVWRLHLAG